MRAARAGKLRAPSSPKWEISALCCCAVQPLGSIVSYRYASDAIWTRCTRNLWFTRVGAIARMTRRWPKRFEFRIQSERAGRSGMTWNCEIRFFCTEFEYVPGLRNKPAGGELSSAARARPSCDPRSISCNQPSRVIRGLANLTAPARTCGSAGSTACWRR